MDKVRMFNKGEQKKEKNETMHMRSVTITCPGSGPEQGKIVQTTGREKALARMRVRKRKSQAAELMIGFSPVYAKAEGGDRLRGSLRQFAANYRGAMRLAAYKKRCIAEMQTRLGATMEKLRDRLTRGLLSEEDVQKTVKKLTAVCPTIDVRWVWKMVERQGIKKAAMGMIHDCYRQSERRSYESAVAQLRSNWATGREEQEMHSRRRECDRAALAAIGRQIGRVTLIRMCRQLTRNWTAAKNRLWVKRLRGKCSALMQRSKGLDRQKNTQGGGDLNDTTWVSAGEIELESRRYAERIAGLRRQKTKKMRHEQDIMLGAAKAPSAPHTKAKKKTRREQDIMLGAERAPSAPYMRDTEVNKGNENRVLWLKQQLRCLRTAHEKWEHFIKSGVE
jgi:hypothetical protein